MTFHDIKYECDANCFEDAVSQNVTTNMQQKMHKNIQIDSDIDECIPFLSNFGKNPNTPKYVETFTIEINTSAGEAFFTKYPDFPLFSSSWVPEEDWEKIPATKAAVMKTCLSKLDLVSIFEKLHDCFHDKKTEAERKNYILGVEKSDDEIMRRLDFLDQKGESINASELQELSQLRLYEKYVIWGNDPWQDWEFETHGVLMNVLNSIKLKGHLTFTR